MREKGLFLSEIDEIKAHGLIFLGILNSEAEPLLGRPFGVTIAAHEEIVSRDGVSAGDRKLDD